MPDDGDGNWCRLVLDESSFDFRGLDDRQVESDPNILNDTLDFVRRNEYRTMKSSMIYDVECRDGVEMHSFLYTEECSTVGRDTRQRTYISFDRLSSWDDGECAAVPLDILIEGRAEPVFAPSVGYALMATVAGCTVGCLVFPRTPAGSRRVSAPSADSVLYFFSAQRDVKNFWRIVLKTEHVPERVFFEIAVDAFPELVLHEALNFGRFDGTYRDLRASVIRILTGLNDNFARVLAECKGVPYSIQAAMGSYGVDLSPESPGTHGSARLMARRDVVHAGRKYRCEWHAKLEPHRNRIHFTLPSTDLGGRILIGLFVDHLPT